MNFYFWAVVASFIMLILFIYISDRKVLFYNASFFFFVFIGNLGYLFLGNATNVEEALLANKLTYIGGCTLALFLIMLVSDACKVSLHKYVRMGMYALSMTVLISAMTAGYTDWFYKSCSIEKVDGITILVKEYGPMHALFLVMMYGYLIVGFAMVLHALFRKKKIVLKNVLLMLAVYVTTVFCYTVGRKLFTTIDPVCLSYCIDDLLLLFITYNTCFYNLDEALMNSIEKQDHQGYLLFDRKFRYVGSNDVVAKFIPDIDSQKLSSRLHTEGSEALAKIEEMIRNYDGGDLRESVSYDGKDMEFSVQYLYKGPKARGYIVRILDDSKHQEYIRQLDLISKNKTNFLSNVSHEIRTPINSVLGMNEMILRECTDDKIREYAMNIASSGQTLLQLINDVLDLSKIESGKLEVLPVEYNLADVISDLENMVRPLIKKDNLKLTIETADDLPKTLFGDAIRVKQMVTNILTNAVKYTEEGTVHFKIAGEKQEDTFLFRYSVKDTGRGIKEADMGNLFNAFERVDQLKNSGIEGTGLGLAITKKFAVMMGGDIEVESTYGEGSTFTVRVPQKIVGDELMGDYHKGRHEKVREEYTESFHAPEAKILAVDDVKMNLTVIKLLLKETKMKITTCASGQACIEAVQKEHFDIILLDHMMPDMDGVETLQALKENHYCDDTPVIALTANADVSAKSRYLEYGFSDYLSKPIDPGMLEEMILDYLPADKIVRNEK